MRTVRRRRLAWEMWMWNLLLWWPLECYTLAPRLVSAGLVGAQQDPVLPNRKPLQAEHVSSKTGILCYWVS